ncbi:hypothetical protein BT96DRAFT_1027297 [Gymnopus androsaceus JB14]|uniref:Uncharacterized protein n=1 Tax=Gymnopus androsaceus JB14 TaxID=1447944 RepID=A0A6A4GCV1_9AGAR|nr:hypothetical protein BT96DRAFT_1027297 [Gymnopus androsaceus JB14]
MDDAAEGVAERDWVPGMLGRKMYNGVAEDDIQAHRHPKTTLDPQHPPPGRYVGAVSRALTMGTLIDLCIYVCINARNSAPPLPFTTADWANGRVSHAPATTVEVMIIRKVMITELERVQVRTQTTVDRSVKTKGVRLTGDPMYAGRAKESESDEETEATHATNSLTRDELLRGLFLAFKLHVEDATLSGVAVCGGL